MRATSFTCLLIALSATFGNAAEPAATPIELEIRVLEISLTQLKTRGFDFAAFAAKALEFGGEVPPGSVRFGVAADGFVSFLDALHAEGLMRQDVTFSQCVADGGSFDTIVRWSRGDGKQRDEVVRSVTLRVRPSLIPGGIRLDAAQSVRLSAAGEPGAPATPPKPLECSMELKGQTLALASDLYTPADSPLKEQLRVMILITPRVKAAGHAARASHPDLLAPRNVLGESSAVVAIPGAFRAQPPIEHNPLEILTDESLFDLSETQGEDDVFVTPDRDFLDAAEAHCAESRAVGMRIKARQKRARRARPNLEDLTFSVAG